MYMRVLVGLSFCLSRERGKEKEKKNKKKDIVAPHSMT
jgi:hypothetical protein